MSCHRRLPGTEPGGEPLCSIAAPWVGSRRLPGTSRSVAVLWAVVPAVGIRRVGQNLTMGHSRKLQAGALTIGPCSLGERRGCPSINLSELAPPQIAKTPMPGLRRKEVGTYSLQRLRQPTGL